MAHSCRFIQPSSTAKLSMIIQCSVTRCRVIQKSGSGAVNMHLQTLSSLSSRLEAPFDFHVDEDLLNCSFMEVELSYLS